MSDFLILRAGAVFRNGSGISEDWEKELWLSLWEFLSKNQLLLDDRELPIDLEGFELRSSQLTNRGIEVMRCGLDKWMRRIGTGKPVSDVSIPKKCLDKV
jgi:hypothetical protein